MISDGDIVATTPMEPCRCGANEWVSVGDGGDSQCAECGTIYTILEEVERVENGDSVIERIHSHLRVPLDDSDDRKLIFRINMGRDDQRPDHDPDHGIYRPICVARHLMPDAESAVYSYDRYCGRCRHAWKDDWKWLHCPYCTARIGNYVFADGMEHWYPMTTSFSEAPSEVWPDAS